MNYFRCVYLVALIFLIFNTPVIAEEIVFPEDAVCYITKPPYNAKGDGKTDDTIAIQQALLDKKRIIYFPKGTYLISDTLKWGFKQNRQIFQGAGREKTVIKLKDNCSGYTDPTAPKAMIWTGKRPAQRFQNGINDLTVDTGKGNGGAIAIQYIANNQGGMHRVNIRSGDELGIIGLDLGYSDEQGPCLINEIHVKGFEVGVSAKHAVDGIVLTNITVEGQKKCGFINDGQCVSIENLKSINSVTGFWNKSGASLAAIIDSEFINPDKTSINPAIRNGSYLFARNIKTSGYKLALLNDVAQAEITAVAGPDIKEFVSHKVLSLFPGKPSSLNLDIKQSPQVPYEPLKDWVAISTENPGFVTVVDRKEQSSKVPTHVPGIQKAIDSGAKVLYYAQDEDKVLNLYGDIHIRKNLSRLVGSRRSPAKALKKVDKTMAEIKAKRDKDRELKKTLSRKDWMQIVRKRRKHSQENAHELRYHPRIFIDDGDAPVVVIQGFDTMYSDLEIIHRSKRTLVINGMMSHSIIVEKGAGDVFLNDVVCTNLRLAPGTKVWARQLNMEGNVGPRATNNGGDLWILGIKTENDPLVIRADNGGNTEIVGGFIYANKDWLPGKVMFEVTDANFSATIGEWVIRKHPFDVLKETRKGETRLLKNGEAFPRGMGSSVPLLVAYSGKGNGKASKPANVQAKTLNTSEIEVSWKSSGNDGVGIELSEDGTTYKTVKNLGAEKSKAVIRNLKADTEYHIRATAFKDSSFASSENIKVRTEKPGNPGNGKGLEAQYYSDKGFTAPHSKLIQTVDLDWNGHPPKGLEKKAFSVRYTGFLVPRYSDIYTITASDYGTRLWLDSKLLFDTWGREKRIRPWTQVKLEAGKKYPIDFQVKIDPGKNKKKGFLTLEWASRNQTKEVIPANQLFPGPPTSKAAVGLTAVSERGKIVENKKSGLIIKRSGGDLNNPLTVNLNISGSAIPGKDFQAIPASITIPEGKSELKIPVQALDDTLVEKDETIKVSLLPNSKYISTGWNPTITIIDNDYPAPGKGTGLTGHYFQKPGFEEAVGKRIDPQIKFNWNKKDPYPGIAVQKAKKGKSKQENKKLKKLNGYSVKWQGKIEPQFSQTYQFELDSSKFSQVELKVDGKTLVKMDKKDHGFKTPIGFIVLEKGKLYDIELKYDFNNIYGSNIFLYWMCDSLPREIVPKNQLFPE